MAIKLPNGLPAADLLRNEGEAVLSEDATPVRRMLRIGLVNLMPRKEATELAFARLLAQSRQAIDLTLIVPGSYRPRNVSAEHLDRFYRRWPEVRDGELDGLVVTGAPVETLDFEEVAYWDEQREMMTWARSHTRSTLYVCWSAQAALYAFRGIPKHLLAEKAFGVFEQRVTAPSSPLLRGMGAAFPVPVSRHTAVSDQALAQAGLAPVARAAESGPCIVDDEENRAVCIFDHLEYDADTLNLEYERDRQAGKAIAPPRNAGGWSWRPFAALFFRNWLDRVSAGEEEADPRLTWLFSGEHRASAQVLVQAEMRPHLMTEFLCRLARAGIDPVSARIQQCGASLAVVGIELDDLASVLVENAASALSEVSGARRVLYRLPDGSGGVFRSASRRDLLASAA